MQEILPKNVKSWGSYQFISHNAFEDQQEQEPIPEFTKQF